MPIEQVLGLKVGDAHIYRNAGGVVTDDVIRSAMLSLDFFGSKEIIVVTHTECGMMSHYFHAGAEIILNFLKWNLGIDIDPEKIQIDPSLPELIFQKNTDTFVKWIRMFQNVDDTTVAQVEMLRKHPLIPKDAVIHGYVYETESGALRAPYRLLSRKVNTAAEMFTKGFTPPPEAPPSPKIKFNW